MQIYDFTDYKAFLQVKIASLPKKGYGQARKLAEHIGAHSVVVSQVLAGDRDFTHEQSVDVAAFFGLDERATEYFLTMVLLARAGTKRLREHLTKRLEGIRAEGLDFKNRIPEHQKLSEEDMAIFYSNWFYSAIRLITSIKGYDNVDDIAAYFGLPRENAAAAIDYLVKKGLCKMDERGRLSAWTTSTFIDAQSPFINNLHRNWRLKALEQMPKRKANDFFYSAPSSISEKDKDAFREELIKLVGSYGKRIQDSKTERLTCLNIDWFDF